MDTESKASGRTQHRGGVERRRSWTCGVCVACVTRVRSQHRFLASSCGEPSRTFGPSSSSTFNPCQNPAELSPGHDTFLAAHKASTPPPPAPHTHTAAMRGTSYSQKTLSLQSRTRVQSPSPSRCRSRGRSGGPAQAVEVGTEIHQHHANEKEEMQELNVRFAGYIEKVQALELRNAALRAELDSLQGRFKAGPAGLGDEYQLKFKEMRDLIEALTAEKGAADIDRGYLEEEVEVWRLKLEEELALKEEAEMILREFRQDVDNATLQKADLEKRIEQLVAEIEFLKKIHDEEVADLLKQIEESKVTVELDSDRPDLAAYLRNMRAEIEAVAARNVQEAEKWYKGKFDSLKHQATKHEGQMLTMKEEITTFHNQVSDLQNQIDSLRARNAGLEQQLDDMELAHLEKVAGLEEVIAGLENQLCETKTEMGRYMADYQELLHIKLKLDAEIATYRKLLEGEEKRLGISISEEVVTE